MERLALLLQVALAVLHKTGPQVARRVAATVRMVLAAAAATI
jgi:hypothetical protein